MLSETLEAAREARSAGRSHEALGCYEAAIPIAVREGAPMEIAGIFLSLGDLHRSRGDMELASEVFEVAVAIADAHGETRVSVRALTGLGCVLVSMGRHAQAEETLGQARQQASGCGPDWLLGKIELGATELYLAQGETDRALEACERAFEVYRRLRSAAGLAETHRWYAALFRAKGQESLSRAHLGASSEAAKACGDRLLEAETLREWAAFHLHGRHYREALESLNRAYRLYADLSASRELLDLESRLDLLEEDYLVVVRAWADTIEAKDRHTTGHCERVATLACLLARQLGIRGRELAWVQMGAYLHDVGKGSISAEVLNREGGLSPDEWARVQHHTVEGHEIIAALNLPWDIGSMVRSHHERWDGYGYPDGLAGEAIPVTARIVCLADVYDALTTDRSFREAFPREEALRIMDAEVGRIFDPELFVLFRAIVLGRAPRDVRRVALPAQRASAA